MKFIIRWLVVAVSLFVAAWLVPGIEIEGNAIVVLAVTALILGLINAVIRPILTILSCGFIVLTLGLFLLVINAVVLWLASYFAQMFGIGFIVHGFLPALLGSIVVSIVSFILNTFLKDGE
jgi:putative membrane protein